MRNASRSFGVLGIALATLPHSAIARYPVETDDCGRVVKLPCGALTPAYKLVEQPDLSHVRELRGLPDDPLFPQQWHLRNTGAGGGTPGIDLNVEPWWDFAGNQNLGAGVVIGIVDSGVEYTHVDLAANYLPDLSYNFLSGNSNAFPNGGTFHGTAVAGLAVGRGNNGIGICGVAPHSGLAALRLTAPTFQTDAMEADALTFQNDNQNDLGTIHIYCNPWGPSDSQVNMVAPGPLTRAALQSAVAYGRGGLGSIITWAAGNGRGVLDNVNYDGYANSRFTIAVGSCTNQGLATSYSEPGACLFVVAPADGGPGANSQITTTDRTGPTGRNVSASPDGDYSALFGGTSAAVPQASGVIALMLEANPNLTWRDVQHILARSSRQISPANPGWTTNAAGLTHHHDFGFGLLDATAAATLATEWLPVPDEVAVTSPTIPVGLAIADGLGTSLSVPVFGPAASSTYTSTASMVLESVVVTLNVTHTYRGDVEVVLTSPSGVESVLSHIRNDSRDHIQGWEFTTVRHWGEHAAGDWTLRLRDGIINDAGVFDSWSIRFHGTPAPVLPAVSLVERTAPDRLTLDFAADPGTQYQVFHSLDLTPLSWQAVGATFPVATSRHEIEIEIDPDATHGFYRLAPVD